MVRSYPSAPIVGVGAVIVRHTTGEAEVLLVRRANPPLQGRWSLPGGALELGEKLRDGIAREVREETGLDVEVGPVLDVIDSIFPDGEGRTQYHYVLVDYLCHPRSGEAVASSDASELCWVRADELESMGIRHITLEVIRKALAIDAAAAADSTADAKRPAL
jgi:8-oxo-dGTP diphosphatase